MTNGPALLIEIFDNSKRYMMGEHCSSPKYCKIKAQSTEEFGRLISIKIIIGDINNRQECLFFKDNIDIDYFDYDQEISLKDTPDKGYIRLEVRTSTNFQALSNPIWI
jgi:hypothetical protein